MSAEDKFEKTRIQNPDEAHEEANMVSVEAGEGRPTAKNYRDALEQLESLEKEANEGSVESMDKALRVFTAGAGVAVERIPRLLVAAALNVMPYPKNVKESTRIMLGGGIIEQLKRIPADYEKKRILFQTAREELEKWKADAEEFSKKQETAEEFNERIKKQAEQNNFSD